MDVFSCLSNVFTLSWRHCFVYCSLIYSVKVRVKSVVCLTTNKQRWQGLHRQPRLWQRQPVETFVCWRKHRKSFDMKPRLYEYSGRPSLRWCVLAQHFFRRRQSTSIKWRCTALADSGSVPSAESDIFNAILIKFRSLLNTSCHITWLLAWVRLIWCL